MAALGLGAVRVVTPGTNVAVPPPSNYGGNPVFPCHAVLFQALSTNTGPVYIGNRGMVATAPDFAGVMVTLLTPTDSAVMSFSIGLPLAPNGLNLDEFWIDAAIATDGVLVSVVKL